MVFLNAEQYITRSSPVCNEYRSLLGSPFGPPGMLGEFTAGHRCTHGRSPHRNIRNYGAALYPSTSRSGRAGRSSPRAFSPVGSISRRLRRRPRDRVDSRLRLLRGSSERFSEGSEKFAKRIPPNVQPLESKSTANGACAQARKGPFRVSPSPRVPPLNGYPRPIDSRRRIRRRQAACSKGRDNLDRGSGGKLENL